METLAWWGLGLGVVVIVGMLVAAIIIQRINMTGLQAIIASQAETIDEVRGVADVMRDIVGEETTKRNEAVASLNEAIARRKEAAGRANVLEGKVRLLESEVAGTVRRCDVEMDRRRAGWEDRIAELEKERDQTRQAGAETLVKLHLANGKILDLEARIERQVRDMDNLADQNKQLADAHDALADEHGREIADLNRELDHMKSQCDGWQRGNATIAAECLAHQERIAELEREAAEATAKGEQAHSDGWHGAKVMLIAKIRKVLHEASLERAPYHVTFDERLAAFHAEPGDFGAADSEGGEA